MSCIAFAILHAVIAFMRAIERSRMGYYLDGSMAGLMPAKIHEPSAMIRSLRDEGMALVVVEHVMEAAMPIADRVMVLDSGSKIAESAPAEVVRDRRVVSALADVSLNIESGEIGPLSDRMEPAVHPGARDMRPREADIRARMEFVFGLFSLLEERESRKAGNLSGGQQQMLALGRGLMANPHFSLSGECRRLSSCATEGAVSKTAGLYWKERGANS